MLHQEHHTLHNSSTENHNMPGEPSTAREPKKNSPQARPCSNLLAQASRARWGPEPERERKIRSPQAHPQQAGPNLD